MNLSIEVQSNNAFHSGFFLYTIVWLKWKICPHKKLETIQHACSMWSQGTSRANHNHRYQSIPTSLIWDLLNYLGYTAQKHSWSIIRQRRMTTDVSMNTWLAVLRRVWIYIFLYQRVSTLACLLLGSGCSCLYVSTNCIFYSDKTCQTFLCFFINFENGCVHTHLHSNKCTTKKNNQEHSMFAAILPKLFDFFSSKCEFTNKKQLLPIPKTKFSSLVLIMCNSLINYIIYTCQP